MTTAISKRRSAYVLLPSTNMWNVDNPGASPAFVRQMGTYRQGSRARPSEDALLAGMQIVDRVAPGDTVLVNMTDDERLALLLEQPGLRILPVGELAPLWLRHPIVIPFIGLQARARIALTVDVVDAESGAPLPNVDVVGYVNRAERVGASSRTNARGRARLMFPQDVTALESVEAYPASGYWQAYVAKAAVGAETLRIACRPIDFATGDARRHFGFEGAEGDGKGVRVAVIDTGVAKHPDLKVARGVNVVQGEKASDVADQVGHGTHVAGIIAGRAAPGKGVRGVAPAAALNVYRVFGRSQETATSFNIAKGIRQAVDDGCDVINLSLGGAGDVPDVLREIQRARALGVVCVAATGNDYRAPVSYPARYSQVMAVTAMGRRGTFPRGALQTLEVARPFGVDRKNFVAAFSNVGSEVSLTGPGVGIVSTYIDGYAVMDGTSMACPVMSGAVARLLAKHPRLLGMARNQKRSDEILRLALNEAEKLGFGVNFEGAGILM
jgi:subtilisin